MEENSSKTDLGEVFIGHIAEVCHAANRALQRQLGEAVDPEWGDLPAWKKLSAASGVRLRLADPLAPIAASHENWLKFMQGEGWIYGEMKDADKKTHPCMRPYKELPAGQRMKDYVFTSIVLTMACDIDQADAEQEAA